MSDKIRLLCKGSTNCILKQHTGLHVYFTAGTLDIKVQDKERKKKGHLSTQIASMFQQFKTPLKCLCAKIFVLGNKK
jgi:hypothetical protein